MNIIRTIYRFCKKHFEKLMPTFFNLIEKYKTGVKYIISGGLAAFVNLFFLFIFTEFLGIWYVFSSMMAFILSLITSFCMHKFWTFRDNSLIKVKKQFIFFTFIALLNLILNAVLIFVLVDKFGIWYMAAQFIIMGIIAFESFAINKTITFRKAKGKDEQKNILIATGIFPPDIGGPATILEALANSLKINGFKIKIITYSNVKHYKDDTKDIVRISKNKSWRRWRYFLKIFILSRWADVIYVTDTYSVGYFAYLIKKLSGRKYIVRFAGDSAWETAAGNGWTNDYIVDFQNIKYNNQIEKLKNKRKKILVKADKVIAVSDFLAGIAKQIGMPDNKMKVIYNSVDFINFKNIESEAREARDRWKLGDSKIIMSAGRLVKWKGMDGLIKVMAILKEDKLKLVIVGDGPERENLEKLAKERGVEDAVIFVGKVPIDKVHSYYNLADVFVLNSQYEGLSHVLLEVLRLNKPIIASRCGGNPEVIENKKNGLLIKYNDVEELSRAIKKVLSENYWSAPERKDACAESLKKFNWEKTIEQTMEVIKEI